MTRDITSEMLMRMPNPAEKWKNYSLDMKEILFKNFMEKYRFTSDYDRNMVRIVWDRTCMDRLSNCLSKARKKAKEMAKSDNIADLKGHGPKGIRTEILDALVDLWMTEEWKKKSIAGKSNRASKPDFMVHTGGSRSFGQHLKKIEEAYKRPVTYGELYNKVHKRKDGQYVSNKAKDFIESYENAIAEKYGEDRSNHPTADSDVWLQIASDNKKGRIHGTGRSLDLSITIHGSSSTVVGPSPTNPTPSTEDITAIATKVSQMQEQMQTQLQTQAQSQMQLQTQMQTQMEAHVQQMQAQMKAQAEMQAKMQAHMQAQMQARMKAQAEMMQQQMQMQMQFFQTEIFPMLQPTPPSVKKT